MKYCVGTKESGQDAQAYPRWYTSIRFLVRNLLNVLAELFAKGRGRIQKYEYVVDILWPSERELLEQRGSKPYRPIATGKAGSRKASFLD